MDNQTYSSSLTAEQFLFYEIKITSEFYLKGIPIEEAVKKIKSGNLFQYPTERHVSRLARACYKRMDALGSHRLVHGLAFAPTEDAKQINLYAMMRYSHLVREFMVQVIGEKYRTQDFGFTIKDLNVFFTRLQAQDDSVSMWSESTVKRIKGVLFRVLIETGYLDGHKDTTLNQILLCETLEQGIRENKDFEALPAFNCFK